MTGTGQSIQQPADFLTQQNFTALLNYTRKTIAEKQGQSDLPEKAEKRLISVLNHYMKEVGRSNPGRKIQELNREVLRETLTSMDSWLRRGDDRDDNRQSESERLFSNVSKELGVLQQERSALQNAAPVIKPDFRDKVEEDAIDPMALFEKARLQREKEGMVVKKPSAQAPELILRDDSPEYKIPQTLPQDTIIRQQDVIKYKEIEYNIFLNSGDRNWITNSSENRYNFSVNFNVGNNGNTLAYSPSLQERFRNITRVETVKVITSLESLDTIVQVTGATGGTYASSPSVSALSFQYVAMRIAELNTNGFGTNQRLDNSFAIMHQDTQWTSDTTANSANKGYVSLAPKYLKCQKIYAPTPLGSLNKLSIRLERPDGTLLSSSSDVLAVQQIVFSGNLVAFAASTTTGTTIYINPPGTAGQLGSVASATQTQNEYIYIQATSYFSKWQVNYPDRIVLNNIQVSGAQTAAVTDFLSFINRAEGHNVVGLAYNSTAAIITDGQNGNGFSNWIIIRNRFKDPLLATSYVYTGGTPTQILTRDYFGSTAANEAALGTTLYNSSSNQITLGSQAALINMNHQTHVVLRVICREMDGATNLRPDNT